MSLRNAVHRLTSDILEWSYRHKIKPLRLVGYVNIRLNLAVWQKGSLTLNVRL